MHFEPNLGQFFMLGGIGDDPAQPEMFFAKLNPDVLAPRPSWRQAMTPNTWVALGSNTLASVDPENSAVINPNGAHNMSPWHGVGGQHQLIDAWNSATYDDLTHSMHIGPAGGHDDYWGNERYKIDLSASSPSWTLLAAPTGAIGNTGVLRDGQEFSGVYFDGRPRSNHTYNFPVYAPGRGPVLPRIVSTSPASGGAPKAFLIDPNTGQTSLLVNYAGTSGIEGDTGVPVGASCYDPTRDCIWTMYAGNAQIQKLNLRTNSVTTHGPSSNYAAGILALYYLPEVDALFLVCRVGGTTVDAGFGASIIDLESLFAARHNYQRIVCSGFRSLGHRKQ